MAIRTTRDALSRIFYQRCFWLFVVLLTLIGAVSFVSASDSGRLLLNVVNMFLLIATVAAVGRTTLSFVMALLLAIPAMWFQYRGLWYDDDRSLAVSWMFSAALYFISTAYLLRYVFQPRIMTPDKLFGAACGHTSMPRSDSSIRSRTWSSGSRAGLSTLTRFTSASPC